MAFFTLGEQWAKKIFILKHEHKMLTSLWYY